MLFFELIYTGQTQGQHKLVLNYFKVFNRATRKYDLSENNNVASDPKVQNFFSSIQFNQSVICPSTLESLQKNGI